MTPEELERAIAISKGQQQRPSLPPDYQRALQIVGSKYQVPDVEASGPGIQKNPYKDWDVTTLGPEDERKFQSSMQSGPGYSDWRKEFEKNYHEAPNYDDPENDYDYRGAWKNNQAPEIYAHDGTYHWESKTPGGEMLKSPDHPTAWMQYFVEATNGLDPNVAGVRNEEEGRAFAAKHGLVWPDPHDQQGQR